MHPEDELEFEHLLLRDESTRFIAGPRWTTEAPKTSRSLLEIGFYCIIWSTKDIAKLKADYIPSCNDWYCRSEHATIQFLRSKLHDAVLTEGRIAVSTTASSDFPAASVRRLDERYSQLRKYFRKNYSNSVIQWRNPTVPDSPARPGRSANPSEADPQVWVGPHALRWLREAPDRRIKQDRSSVSEGVLIESVG